MKLRRNLGWSLLALPALVACVGPVAPGPGGAEGAAAPPTYGLLAGKPSIEAAACGTKTEFSGTFGTSSRLEGSIVATGPFNPSTGGYPARGTVTIRDESTGTSRYRFNHLRFDNDLILIELRDKRNVGILINQFVLDVPNQNFSLFVGSTARYFLAPFNSLSTTTTEFPPCP